MRRRAHVDASNSVDIAYEPPNASTNYSRADNTVVYLEIAEVSETGSRKVLGRLNIELRKDIAPVASNNFEALVKGELGVVDGVPYSLKNTRIHRVVKDVLIQGGDLLDTRGECSRSIYNRGGYFKDENFILRHVGAGVVSYCNMGPNTNGSVFQITLTKNESLDSKCVVFGCVVCENSLNTLSKINLLGHPLGEPSREIRIVDCGIVFPLDYSTSS